MSKRIWGEVGSAVSGRETCEEAPRLEGGRERCKEKSGRAERGQRGVGCHGWAFRLERVGQNLLWSWRRRYRLTTNRQLPTHLPVVQQRHGVGSGGGVDAVGEEAGVAGLGNVGSTCRGSSRHKTNSATQERLTAANEWSWVHAS